MYKAASFHTYGEAFGPLFVVVMFRNDVGVGVGDVGKGAGVDAISYSAALIFLE